MMPAHYHHAMEEKGFELRRYDSIEEYLQQKNVAPIWYFTRLQLERMGERLQNKAIELRRAVTFQREWMQRLPEATKFFHPLPRHSETPTIPSFLDKTPLNGWDQQSRNGYLTRIIEIALLGGHLGDDFEGTSITPPSFDGRFIFDAPITKKQKREYKIGIRPVENGLVIDHIGKGKPPQIIWEHISTIRRLLDLNVVSSHGVYKSEGDGVYKGIISIPGQKFFDQQALETLGAAAPGCTLNQIEEAQVVEKLRLGLPPRVTGLRGIRCKNEDCISAPGFHEPIYPDFYRSSDDLLTCRYCETPHSFNEIWGNSWANG
jgi:aspartate carbamoyltransferase